ncbi:protein CREG1-like [Ptychodera flava]|uniref:protein CREG1-like n=1 Tax=Ptychodera flava TaxID=63121 RepID=UPI00396A185A
MFWISAVAILIGICSAVEVQESYHVMKAATYSVGDRPPYMEYAARARYMVHRADWAIINTVSIQPGMLGFPFGNILSISDGLVDNSTGIPYVYLTRFDVSVQDFSVNNNVTMTFTENEFPDINECKPGKISDPESPLCSRLILIGSMANITDATELEFAKKVLFTRHPYMTDWPATHEFRCMKMIVKGAWIIDFFGGGVTISAEDYFKAKP